MFKKNNEIDVVVFGPSQKLAVDWLIGRGKAPQYTIEGYDFNIYRESDPKSSLCNVVVFVPYSNYDFPGMLKKVEELKGAQKYFLITKECLLSKTKTERDDTGNLAVHIEMRGLNEENARELFENVLRTALHTLGLGAPKSVETQTKDPAPARRMTQ